MQVPSLEMHEAVVRELRELRQEVVELRAQLPAWVGQEEACNLSGYSRTWFFRQRRAGTLPIGYHKAGPRTITYSRADCVALGRKNLILPPAGIS